MRKGIVLTGLIRCDQPGCDYTMEFERPYTGYTLDTICIRIDRLDYHRNEAHPEVVTAENAAEETPR